MSCDLVAESVQAPIIGPSGSLLAVLLWKCVRKLEGNSTFGGKRSRIHFCLGDKRGLDTSFSLFVVRSYNIMFLAWSAFGHPNSNRMTEDD